MMCATCNCAELPKALLAAISKSMLLIISCQLFCPFKHACYRPLFALLGLLVNKVLFMPRSIILHVFNEELSMPNITFGMQWVHLAVIMSLLLYRSVQHHVITSTLCIHICCLLTRLVMLQWSSRPRPCGDIAIRFDQMFPSCYAVSEPVLSCDACCWLLLQSSCKTSTCLGLLADDVTKCCFRACSNCSCGFAVGVSLLARLDFWTPNYRIAAKVHKRIKHKHWPYLLWMQEHLSQWLLWGHPFRICQHWCHVSAQYLVQ